MTENKLVVGKCPKCGGDVVKTFKGYSCVNALGDNAACNFSIFGLVANKRLSDHEVSRLLENMAIIVDGCANKEMKLFSSILSVKEDGTLDLNSRLCKCPKCGGDIFVGTKGFNCSNFANPEIKCGFVIWRNISGHDITCQEAKEICEKGATELQVEVFDQKGEREMKRLALSSEKDKVVKL